MVKYKLMEVDGEEVLNDIDLTKYEFTQALIMHKRLQQKKER